MMYIAVDIRIKSEHLTLATRMSNTKIKEFEIQRDSASIEVRWKKWLTLLEDNFDWFDNKN